MSFKLGKRTKTKGWCIMKNTKGSWRVIGHSENKTKALSGIRAKSAGKSNVKW